MNDTLIKSEKDWEKFFDVKHSFVSVDRESMTELKSLSKGTHIFPSDDSFLSQNINFPPTRQLKRIFPTSRAITMEKFFSLKFESSQFDRIKIECRPMAKLLF